MSSTVTAPSTGKRKRGGGDTGLASSKAGVSGSDRSTWYGSDLFTIPATGGGGLSEATAAPGRGSRGPCAEATARAAGSLTEKADVGRSSLGG